MEIRIVRLSSGEEVICKYKADKETSTLKNPALLVPMGGGQLGLMGWMPYADYKELTLNNEFIMFAIKPQTELMNQYNESIGNGLVVPDKKVSSPKLTLTP